MRFSRLRIPAYGPFTDFELVLPKRTSDLHIIYGPNEAGKSSLLRAIRGLLYGIPTQSADNFVHEYNRLRISADLMLSDGLVRTFQRRKGNKNTLLNHEGHPITESELQRFLGGVDADYFDSMFGLNSDRLRSGADSLLRGEGRLGEALFSASMGGTPVDIVIREIEAEAEEIFSGRSQRRLRQALNAQKEHLERKKAALVKAEEWDETEQQLNEVEKRLAHLQNRRQELGNRKAWLERCRDALVLVGKLRDHEQQLASLHPMDGLPESFARDLLTARTAKESKDAEFQRLAGELARIREQITGCSPDESLLHRDAVIQRIHSQLGVYTSEKIALGKKQFDAEASSEIISRTCHDLGITAPFEALEPFRITLLQCSQAQENAEKLKAVAEQVEQAEKRLGVLSSNISKWEGERSEVDDARVTILKSLRDRAAASRDVADKLPSRQRVLELQQKRLREFHQDLHGAPNDSEQASKLAVPTKATLERFRIRWEESERDIRASRETIRKGCQQVADQMADIEGLMRLRDIPDLQQLMDARAHRDRGWQVVLQEWKGGGTKEQWASGKPLEEAYPDAVSAADQIADRLRTEADAVAKVAEKRLHLTRQREKLQDEETHLAVLQQHAAAMHEEWAKVWQPCGISPLSPSEMLAWRDIWQEFRRTWSEVVTEKDALEADSLAVESVRSAIAAVLGDKEDNFEELRQRLMEELDCAEKAKQNQIASEKLVEEARQEMAIVEAKLVTLNGELKVVRQHWSALTASLSVPSELSTARALELLNGRRDLFREVDRLSDLQTECRNLQASILQFEQLTKETATGTGLVDAATEILADALWTNLQTAQKAKQKLDTLKQDEATKDKELQRVEVERKGLETDLARHLAMAGLQDASTLDEFAAEFSSAQEHRRSLANYRESIAGLARGEAVDAFIARISTENAIGLEGELAELEQNMADQERQLEEARSQKQDAAAKRAVLEKAGDEAARCEQRAKFEEGFMLGDARRFIELKMAVSLLKGQINLFREQNQGPFLSKASDWFSKLTGGGFQGIVTSFSEGDEPMIAGSRTRLAISEEVSVAGMSEGTRDQLCLALRLAGLQLHLEDHDPMPLVLDDLLVHFDDERAEHALRALAVMSKECQILLFTHHQHVLELARGILAGEHSEHSI